MGFLHKNINNQTKTAQKSKTISNPHKHTSHTKKTAKFSQILPKKCKVKIAKKSKLKFTNKKSKNKLKL